MPTIDTLALIATIVGAATTAAWVLRSKLSDVESALNTHVTEDTLRFAAQDARIIRLEKRRR